MLKSKMIVRNLWQHCIELFKSMDEVIESWFQSATRYLYAQTMGSLVLLNDVKISIRKKLHLGPIYKTTIVGCLL